MPTNLAIDDRLLEEAQRVGRHRTKRETVTVALQEYIEHRKQQEILSLLGTLTTNVVMTTSESARQSAYECFGRHICFFPGASSKKRKLKYERKTPSRRVIRTHPRRTGPNDRTSSARAPLGNKDNGTI